MTRKIDSEALTCISKEAELFSHYAWLVTISSDPQAQSDNHDALLNQWQYLQRVVEAALPEVQS